MKNLAASRTAALKDMRQTLATIRAATTRIEIYREAERLSSQAFYLRQMAATAIERGGVLYPEHDWDFYRQAVNEEHPLPTAS